MMYIESMWLRFGLFSEIIRWECHTILLSVATDIYENLSSIKLNLHRSERMFRDIILVTYLNPLSTLTCCFVCVNVTVCELLFVMATSLSTSFYFVHMITHCCWCIRTIFPRISKCQGIMKKSFWWSPTKNTTKMSWEKNAYTMQRCWARQCGPHGLRGCRFCM